MLEKAELLRTVKNPPPYLSTERFIKPKAPAVLAAMRMSQDAP